MCCSSSNAAHTICSCPICTCTCDASFRRDQLQSIHNAKQFEIFENKPKNLDNTETAVKHTAIHDLTKVITSHAKDAINEVLQRTSPIRTRMIPSSSSGWSSTEVVNDFDPREIEAAIERSLGMTALSMHKDVGISGNISL